MLDKENFKYKFKVRIKNHLPELTCKWFSIRAENETRTRDPQLGKLMLYQLSYFRIEDSIVGLVSYNVTNIRSFTNSTMPE